MKLFELKGIKAFKDLNGYELLDLLDKKGVFKKKLGKGAYAYAFELHGGDVLKVWVNDPAFQHYIEYCEKHKNDPWLLKIKGKVQKFKIKDTTTGEPRECRFVRIEKLEMPTSMKDFGYDSDNKDDLEIVLENMNEWLYLLVKGKINMDEFYEKSFIKKEKVTPKFEEFLKEAIRIYKDNAIDTGVRHPDYKKENFGLRGKQIVFLDPYAQSYGALSLNDVLEDWS